MRAPAPFSLARITISRDADAQPARNVPFGQGEQKRKGGLHTTTKERRRGHQGVVAVQCTAGKKLVPRSIARIASGGTGLSGVDCV